MVPQWPVDGGNRSETKKSKHKDYEKNRRLKLNEELKANDFSNELIEKCIGSDNDEPANAKDSHGTEHSSQSSDEDHSDDEGVSANKRVILQRTRNQLASLCDLEAGDCPLLYNSPADMENLAMNYFPECLTIRFVVTSGEIVFVMGTPEDFFGNSKEELETRMIWSYVPDKVKDDSIAFFKAHADAAKGSRDPTSLHTLLVIENSNTGDMTTFRVDGRFSYDGETFTCILVQEPDDRDYDRCRSFMSVDLEGTVTAVDPGCEKIFYRATHELQGSSLRDLFCAASHEPTDLIFKFHVEQFLSKDLNPEEHDTLWMSEVFRVVDRNGVVVDAEYRLAIKPICNPAEYESFDMIGTNLLIFDNDHSIEEIIAKSNSESDAMQRAMSWTDT